VDGLVYFVAFGIDGITPLETTVKTTLFDREKETEIKEVIMDQVSNFYLYPKYPEIEGAQKYEEKESNFQVPELFGADLFEYNKVYDVNVSATKESETVSKKTWFQLYEVKDFDLLSSVASFYGVETEVLIKDNHLQDELIIEGNVLFIREPKRNLGVEYVTEDLSEDSKRQIDAALQGRGVQCEYGFEPINLNTGNFLFETTDFSVRYLDRVFEFGRTYNSTNANHLGIFGYGTSHSAEYIVTTNQDKSVAQVYLSDGKIYVFKKDENGKYINDLKEGIELIYDNGFIFKTTTETIKFNKNGMVKEVMNQHNEVFKYFYLNGRLSTIEILGKKKIQFTYNKDNLVRLITLPDGKSVRYEYDGLDLIGYIDVEGYMAHYTFDEAHNMISWTNRNNELVVTNEYNSEHRVVKQKDNLGNEFLLSYEEGKTVIINGEGIEEIITVDALKQTQGHRVGGVEGKIKKYEKGLLLEETLQNGVNYKYSYENAHVTKVVRNDGFTENYEYDGKYNLVEKSNSEGQVYTYKYDGNNNVIEETDAMGYVTKTSYNELNQITQVTDAMGRVTKTTYNGEGYPIKIENPDGSSKIMSYNESGMITSMTDGFGNTIQYQHSLRNELVLVMYPDGTDERYSYDGSGNGIEYQDRNGNMTKTEVDIYGNIVKSIDGNGNATEYIYDGNQQVIKTMYPNGSVDEIMYDPQGRVIETITKGQSTKTSYNQFGIEKQMDGLGLETRYEYDPQGRIIKTNYPNQTSIQTSYDMLGRVASKTDTYGLTTTYSYNLNNQIIKVTDSHATTTKTYNKNGQLMEEKRVSDDSEQITTKEYNTAGQLMASTDIFGAETTYSYDKDRVTKIIDALGNSTSYQYDSNGKVSKEEFSDGFSTG